MDIYTVYQAIMSCWILISVCRLDVELCNEPEEAKHLFHENIIPSALEDDDVTHRNSTFADSQKRTEKSNMLINA